MSEAGDYDPGPWKGYSFKAARKVYDKHVGRSYDDAVASGKKRKDLVPDMLKTESDSPLVIACDVTGSMGDWPATIFSKLPYLDIEGKEYLGKGMEISFAAIGDVFSDDYPFQARPFDSGKKLKKRLEELITEGGGGGTAQESYDLTALYYARNVEMPNAVKPIFIFIGDEGLYDFVDKAAAKEWARTSLEGRMSSEEAIRELQNKFSVYLIRKPYGSTGENSRTPEDRGIHQQWEDCLGADHVSMLPSADRVVDVIFGILAKETNRIDYFREELTDRQKPHQVKEVLKSLYTVHKIGPMESLKKLPEGYSRMPSRHGGKKGKPLL